MGSMQYNTAKGGVVINPGDQCDSCIENYMGQVRCLGVTALLQALCEGFELVMRYCPHYQPREGKGRRQ